jgi:hypothetical protein
VRPQGVDGRNKSGHDGLLWRLNVIGHRFIAGPHVKMNDRSRRPESRGPPRVREGPPAKKSIRKSKLAERGD